MWRSVRRQRTLAEARRVSVMFYSHMRASWLRQCHQRGGIRERHKQRVRNWWAHAEGT